MKVSSRLSAVVATILSHAAANAYGAASASAPGVSAELQEVVVTATRRSESLQDVPITMQALTGASLSQLNVQTFDDYIKRLRENIPDSSDLLSTEYRYFSSKIHHICYDLSAARTDGVEFMNWLRDNHWRIVICTHRDLRRVSISTRTWLLNNRIPYDYLFMASNKLEFCWIWGIEFLVDDNLFYASSGSRYGVSVFYPIMPKHDVLPNNGARGFS